MLQNKSRPQTFDHNSEKKKGGLVFSLPKPVINNHKTTIQFPQQNQLSKHNNKPHHLRNLSEDNIYQLQNYSLLKKKKKHKEKSHSLFLNNKIENRQEEKEKYNQKSILKETLYKKFIEKAKNFEKAPDFPYQHQLKDKNQLNVKLRQLNLVVLSKRQQLKRQLKTKSQTEKQKSLQPQPELPKQKSPSRQTEQHPQNLTFTQLTQKLTPNSNPTNPHPYPHKDRPSLPQFARSKSSFYKSSSNCNDYNYSTLAFLSKTIFSQIQNHFTAHFTKEKASEPMELGITKLKIGDKGSTKAKRRRRVREGFGSEKVFQHAYDGQDPIFYHYNRSPNAKINLFYNQAGEKNLYNLALENKKKKDKGSRKQTQLKGWDEQINDDNLLPQSRGQA